ncbi:MAG TPA: alpha-glucuronidase, partial [Rugosimonospora sp.]|nr:alpha-glucuronidase [Rugosimonospora sp.]
MEIPELTDVHPAWLPPEALRALGSRRTLVVGEWSLVATVLAEVEQAAGRHGGGVRHDPAPESVPDLAGTDLLLALRSAGPLPAAVDGVVRDAAGGPGEEADAAIGAGGFVVGRVEATTVVVADDPAGLLYGLFQVVRDGESAFTADRVTRVHRPALARRVVDDWDNVDVHPVMGQVERGYAGGSICWRDGTLRDDLSRVRAYARLLASCGVNGLCVNNVNVHATEARLLTDRLGEVAAIADQLRPYGIRAYLSVNFAAPLGIGGLDTADPLDGKVRAWWAETTARVYEAIPDFGGYVVKADSEGQPGPFGYGRTHADGANALADALAPFGGVVYWRAFVYNHRQDWRDRSTDRARAAYDHFAPLDGAFRDNAILQVKYGPIDFQTREPVSPVIAAMPNSNVAVELQVTQEYTGQQRHVCYLAPLWTEVLGFAPGGGGAPTVAEIAARGGGLVGVSNVGDDAYWTGHPLAQANLYAFARLTWDPRLDPGALLDEWIDLTFGRDPAGAPDILRRTLHEMMDGSWRTYERYTAPLGIG